MVRASQVCIGFDGFIDVVVHPVKKRMDSSRFSTIKTLKALAKRIAEASHKNANIELAEPTTHLGGNAPILCEALASLGHPSTLLGCCGYPFVDEIFSHLEHLGIQIHSFAKPGQTEAVECSDGKLLLGKMGELGTITLDQMIDRLSPTCFLSCLKEASLIAAVNWTMMPLVGEFLDYLLSQKDLLTPYPRKQLFIDLADPAKRPKKDLLHLLKTLKSLNDVVDVTLGLNRAESEQVASALSLVSTHPEQRALTIAKKLGLATVVIHSRAETAVAMGPFSTSLAIPVCKDPIRTTGAGDTFNAGFISGILDGDPIFRRLQKAVAASNIWIRTGSHPTAESTKAFIIEHLS